jgi:hypothetical protein
MKVFLVWGGDRSNQAAQVLHWWLPRMFQDVQPFHSELSTEKGRVWSAIIRDELLNSDFGIVAVTAACLESRWAHFESGALSKLEQSNVVPFLFGVGHEQVTGPLKEYQWVSFDHGGLFSLSDTINKRRPAPMIESVLRDSFERWWPDLSQKLEAVLNDPELDKGTSLPDRSDTDMLKEILELTRQQDRTIDGMIGDSKWTFRGNAQLDEFREADFRQVALGLAMLKTLADIERLDAY